MTEKSEHAGKGAGRGCWFAQRRCCYLQYFQSTLIQIKERVEVSIAGLYTRSLAQIE